MVGIKYILEDTFGMHSVGRLGLVSTHPCHLAKVQCLMILNDIRNVNINPAGFILIRCIWSVGGAAVALRGRTRGICLGPGD
jgi:hypothetical protein